MKLLKISAEELEPKTLDEFVNKQHSVFYDKSNGTGLKGVDIAALAKVEFDHYEKRRGSKKNQLTQYMKAIKAE